jgi:hypothetical protein
VTVSCGFLEIPNLPEIRGRFYWRTGTCLVLSQFEKSSLQGNGNGVRSVIGS